MSVGGARLRSSSCHQRVIKAPSFTLYFLTTDDSVHVDLYITSFTVNSKA